MKKKSILIAIVSWFAFNLPIYATEPYYSEDFETWTTLSTHWYFEGGSSNWSVDSSQSASGSNSLRLDLPSGVSSSELTYAYSNLFSVIPGREVRIAGYIKTEAMLSTSKYYAAIRISGIHVDESLAEITSTTDGFVYFEKTILIPKGTTSLRVYLRGFGSSGHAWFDDITLTMRDRVDETGLYAHWPLNGDLLDYGLNHIELSSYGDTVPSEQGYICGCYEFDNINNGPQLLYSDSINIESNNAITVTGWINPFVLESGFTSTAPHTIMRLYNSTDGDTLVFRIRDGKLEVYYTNPTSNNLTSFDVPVNQWSFVAVVQSGVNLAIYLNDEKQLFTVLGGCLYHKLTIGSLDTGSLRGFTGLIDDVRIYKTVLTDSELLELANYSVSDINRDRYVNLPDLSALVSQWLFETSLAIPEDLNGDGKIDMSDFSIMADEWLETTLVSNQSCTQ